MNMTKWVFLFLQSIKHTNEIVLATITENGKLMFIEFHLVYMRKLSDFCQISFFDIEDINGNDMEGTTNEEANES